MTPIISEGYPFIGACFFLALLVGFSISPYVAVIPLVLMFYFCYFFRNPRREIAVDEDVILSPADGTVTDIVPMETDEFVKEPCNKVVIFMSVFNVHVNRSPINGKIKLQKYFCGRFRPAYKDTVGFENEHHVLGIENERIRISVKQIAGILARRIVSYVTLDDELKQGELYGMIKFGSCLEVVMPKNVEIAVTKGQKVAGGQTILGRIKD
ncbi:MAG: phosphatidylserine decarboxylase family protein [Selenomonas sp.]|uniref:phosphatidylserine decarboxylase family protein n=1 Tax=Selenomonas sp. AE3005 TaxID=1485543 RepID=UPI0004806BF8|nr:phosphatidylserine decarboxylase family protein [Selenomonas sp. AE3005]MBQ1416791.1 phosphatidylserine decarboxylase family protein [Selenomonas sp.]MBQ1808148.1 phosphatidylserine decarboxylase family protein [Selenomonas sp.]MBQ1919764.1 phosphatidylserine decarboxylase family protein [Selenomonas sp.]MBQ4212674.1 phosphatidylserine decarboxylase family protein [Selenomonas sp.]MBQ5419268.1 phosphatidylserine decarboxylase family protein [Selenomonas sp.]